MFISRLVDGLDGEEQGASEAEIRVRYFNAPGGVSRLGRSVNLWDAQLVACSER